MPAKSHSQKNKRKQQQTINKMAKSQMHGHIMDHAKMTFVELQQFRIPDSVMHQISAIHNSAIISKLETAIWEWILRYLLSKPRKNKGALSNSEKTNFNAALQAAISAGTYSTTAAIHAANHMMHSFMGFKGTLRFLAWHRAYLYEMEQLLQSYNTGVTIPYWDWANDHTLPSWVILPTGVTRGPDTSYTLPSQSDINNQVLNQTGYIQFTQNLEGFHNTVHMWVGGNTMPYPSLSPHDPMFWLHHANVDRIWAQWQSAHPGVNPPLSGTDATMDPWSLTVTDVIDTFNLWYYYG